MFVELIDHLRCPEPHAETWLVMTADETRDRHVIRGALGCPVCMRRYEVAGGAVHFGAGATTGAGSPASPPDAGDEWPLRLAAFLDLGDGRGVVGLYGTWARYAEALGDVADRVEPLAIAPAGATHPMLSAILPASRARIPLASGALRAVAVDGAFQGDPAAELTEAARLVRPGGRLLAPADAPLPFGVKELARDAAWWVGEREGAPSGVVSLGRRPAG